jgi:hypothetical protein
MAARGVVGPRIDSSEESRPTPRRLSQATCTRWSTYSVVLMRTTLGRLAGGAATYPRGYLSVLRVPFRDPPLRRRLEIVKTESDQWRAYRKTDHQYPAHINLLVDPELGDELMVPQPPISAPEASAPNLSAAVEN